jgi:hypothetical protein
VLLKEAAWIDPALVAPELARALKSPRSDAVRACRLQRGILVEGAAEDLAENAVSVLKDFGVSALAVPDSDVPILPKPVHVSLAHVQLDGFATPSVTGAGLPKLWPWEDLALLAGGILMDPQAQSAGLFDKIEDAAVADAQDRQAVAARQLERARNRVFPLAAEVQRVGEVGEALEAALSGKSTAIEHEVEGFGKIGTVLDLVFTKPFERLRITGKARVTGIEHSSSRARNLHLAMAEIAPNAGAASQPAATQALIRGDDSGEYLFEDLGQFDMYCRWVYYWKLRSA